MAESAAQSEASGASCSSCLDYSVTNDSSNVDDSANDGQIGSSMNTPSPKRKRYSFIFRKYLSKTFPWATESKRGRSWAFCMRCHRDISMGQGGVKDLKRHEMTALHTRAEKSGVGAMPFSTYFGPV